MLSLHLPSGPPGYLSTEHCLGLLCLLQATVVLWWVIAHVPKWLEAIVLHSAHLFVALLFQIFSTSQQMPWDIKNFWRACRQNHRLPSNPNRSQSSRPSPAPAARASASSVTCGLVSAHRFAVQAVKALLRRLGWHKGLVALERKRVWDTLLCAHTRHYAAGLLAR